MKKVILFIGIILIILGCNKQKNETYLTKLNQSFTNAPVATTQINEIGLVTWVRNGEGVYQGNFNESLDGNVFADITQPSNVNTDVRCHLTDEFIQVYTMANNEFSDNVLIDVSLKIIIYNN